MDRRTYTFVVASAAFLFFYLSLRAVVAPPQQQGQDDQVAQQDAEATDGESTTADAVDDAAPTSEEMLAGEGAEKADDEGVRSTTGATKWFTIGSMAANSNQNLLITFSNRGGAIERIELTTRDEDGAFAFRRVDTKTGYLGYFAGQPSQNIDGMIVNVVGPGTPAAEAVAKTGEKGIQVGDVIMAIGATPIAGPDDIATALQLTKPGDKATIEVARGGNLRTPGRL